MIREDRELLAELARLNTDMTPLCMRIMDGSATASEQHYAERLIAAGERFRQRADSTDGVAVSGTIIEGEGVAELVALTSGDRNSEVSCPSSSAASG